MACSHTIGFSLYTAIPSRIFTIALGQKINIIVKQTNSSLIGITGSKFKLNSHNISISNMPANTDTIHISPTLKESLQTTCKYCILQILKDIFNNGLQCVLMGDGDEGNDEVSSSSLLLKVFNGSV